MPTAQLEHVVDDAAEAKKPTGQLKQAVACKDAEYVPAAHAAQLELPITVPYSPETQLEHDVAAIDDA